MQNNGRRLKNWYRKNGHCSRSIEKKNIYFTAMKRTLQRWTSAMLLWWPKSRWRFTKSDRFQLSASTDTTATGKICSSIESVAAFFFRHWCLRSAITKFADGIALPPMLPYVAARARAQLGPLTSINAEVSRKPVCAPITVCPYVRRVRDLIRSTRVRIQPVHRLSEPHGKYSH